MLKLVKICQFEFSVMTEKNIFVYTLFLLLNTSDFSLFFCKIATPLKKLPPLFQQPPLKVEVLSSPSLFENFVGGSTPPADRGVAHYDNVHININ